MLKIVANLFGAAILSLGLSAPAAAAEFTLKVSSPAPLTDIDPFSAWLKAFESGVEERSGGRIDVELYPLSQLGPIPATVEGVAMGTIEMTTPIIGFLNAVDPRFQVFDANGLFDDEHHALRTMADPRVKAMMAELGAQANVEPLFILTSGQIAVVTRDRISSVDDLQGKKLRTGGSTDLINRPMQALGVSPVAMPLGDVLPGIQTGTIDGAATNMPVIVGSKFADVAKHATYLPGNFLIVGGIVSKDFLARIGPELEAIIREEADASKSAYKAKLDSGPAALEATFASQGGTMTVMDHEQRQRFLDSVVPVVEEVVASNPQLKADYELLKQAAEDARQ
ncbi:TRAP transporter substrate-binding protein [Chelativorans alearense]|uniref:TRAP transporter substrate-binding protein n=1 Tax=Chelativorans alearense TaxID=2681495 RepID=UPI0013D11C56|nr:TRAP transporter substrate-binding protein [Chelativorans alearense]